MSRHRWIDDTCKHCGMTRKLEPAQSQRGCFGSHRFERMTYRLPGGRQAGGIFSDANRVPPCRPAK